MASATVVDQIALAVQRQQQQMVRWWQPTVAAEQMALAEQQQQQQMGPVVAVAYGPAIAADGFGGNSSNSRETEGEMDVRDV
ncbi:hypothetical protein SLEP1_g8772 [Rubroshorea leprosula]|uniref:Uncharacterized protein n=1 Tax=Rubroshorea leprosula TaxID=152421 RepID=A0AAV5I2R6_9ROSI|nr:hypothetical protein SLEP1_g8772 [Rubroshorea leprosula]